MCWNMFFCCLRAISILVLAAEVLRTEDQVRRGGSGDRVSPKWKFHVSGSFPHNFFKQFFCGSSKFSYGMLRIILNSLWKLEIVASQNCVFHILGSSPRGNSKWFVDLARSKRFIPGISWTFPHFPCYVSWHSLLPFKRPMEPQYWCLILNRQGCHVLRPWFSSEIAAKYPSKWQGLEMSHGHSCAAGDQSQTHGLGCHPTADLAGLQKVLLRVSEHVHKTST